MRAFVAFLFVAGGIVATESLAEDLIHLPAGTVTNGSQGTGPIAQSLWQSGTTHREVFSSDEYGSCGCSEDGNCACHGSYKYPVPPQYDYFWPGIYGQQPMTHNVSPWRYPDLNPIPEYWKLDPTEDNSPYSGYRY